MIANNDLYTQKELEQILGIDQSNVSRRLASINSYFQLIDNGHKVKAYPLSVLPKDIKRAVIAAEMAAMPETSLEVAAKMLPEPSAPLKAWQREIRDARLLVLNCVNDMAPAAGKTKAAKEFAERSKNGRLNAELAALVQKATAKNMGQGVCARTLHGWQKDLKTKGPDALAPSGGMPPAWPPWLDKFLQTYQVPGQPSIKLAYERLTAQGEQLPDLRTVQNWVKRLGKIESNKGRLGMLELKKYRVHSLRKTNALLPTDVFTADGYSAKFYVQNPYNGKLLKPELVTIIDVASRAVVGFAAGLAENRFNTLSALKDAISKCGVPAIFYTDNGPGFKNKMLGDPVLGLMTKLGISDHNSIPGRAWSRGLIERAQSSIWSKHASLLPAYSNADSDRHQQRRLMKSIAKDLAEHGQSDKLMTWAQLMNWCQNTIDTYNNTPHSGLPQIFDSRLNKMRRQTPAEYFRRLAVKAEFCKPDANMLNSIMRPRVLRTPHNGWIRFENQQYFSRDLEAYHGQQVIVEYDPADINRLWVRNANEQLVCLAERDGNSRDYFPRSVIEHAIEKRRDSQIALKARQIEDIKAEARGQFVIDISPEEKAEIIQFREDFYKVKFVRPESDLEKYKLWRELNQKQNLTPEEQEFYEVFAQSRGYIEGEREYIQRENFRENVRRAHAVNQ